MKCFYPTLQLQERKNYATCPGFHWKCLVEICAQAPAAISDHHSWTSLALLQPHLQVGARSSAILQHFIINLVIYICIYFNSISSK